MVQVSVFKAKDFDKVGYTPTGSSDRLYCCSPELKALGVCEEEYTLIIKPDAQENIYVENVEFFPEFNDLDDDDNDGNRRRRLMTTKNILINNKNNLRILDDDIDAEVEKLIEGDVTDNEDDNTYTGTSYIDVTFPITQTGLYYLMFSSCNELTGDVIISGETEWVNPYGYLPGELYGFLPFYSKLSFIYLIAAITWASLCAYHWRQLLMLQNFITIVLALGMIEVSMRYFDFATFNKVGTRSTGLMLTASLFSTCKKTVSRLLVLIVSLGYGVVKPSLGEAAHRILLLGAVYFIFATVQHIVENVSHTSTITFSQYLLMLPVSTLDLLFIFWIYRGLTQTIEHLQQRKQDIKLSLYVNFRRILILCFSIAVGWSLYFMMVIVTNKIQKEWQSKYIFDLLPDLIYFAVLVPIMILFRPTANSHRYEYSQVAAYDDYEVDHEEYADNLEENVQVNKEDTEVEQVINSIIDTKQQVPAAKKD